MNVGMLWFDGDPQRDVPDRILRAAEYYRTKYGRTPTLCFLHPSTAGAQPPLEVGGLRVRMSDSVLRDHLWIGVEEGARQGGDGPSRRPGR